MLLHRYLDITALPVLLLPIYIQSFLVPSDRIVVYSRDGRILRHHTAQHFAIRPRAYRPLVVQRCPRSILG